jgi:hypothetical protein
MIGIAVCTGKYRPEDEERIRAAADLVVDSLRWPLVVGFLSSHRDWTRR